MISKGLDFYTYLGDGFTVEVKKNNAGGGDDEYTYDHTDNFNGPIKFTIKRGIISTEAHFVFCVRKDGDELTTKTLRIKVGAISTIREKDLEDLGDGLVMENGCVIAFGIYNADESTVSKLMDKVPLTDRIQLYVYATENKENWQEKLFTDYKNRYGDLEQLKLRNLLLPGSHDSGMFLPVILPAKNMANTQQNTIYQQLQLGARYFDFRPGIIDKENISSVVSHYLTEYIPPLLLPTSLIKRVVDSILAYSTDEFQHVHLFVPGVTYRQFLQDIFRFLAENEQEIVVVEICSSGFAKVVQAPRNKSELKAILNDVEHYGIEVGDSSCLKDASVQALLDQNKRLILAYSSLDSLEIASSYTDDGYHTYISAKVPEQLASTINNEAWIRNMKGGKCPGFPASTYYVYAALQLTPVDEKKLKGAIARSFLAEEHFTSPLRATKAATDNLTYKFLSDNQLDYHRNERIILAGNDFYDNALTEVAEKVNRLKLDI